LSAVADLDDDAREGLRARHNVPRGYREYRDLLADQSVDVVDICVPNYLHAEIAAAAMDDGKAVVCEKPLATSLEDGKKVLSSQARTGAMYFYAEDWIFAPALVRAQGLLAEGAVGRPLFFKGKECHNGSPSQFAQKISTCGGGSLLHLGAHPIGYFNSLLGMPESLTGFCSGGGKSNLLRDEVEGEDWGVGILVYPDGTRALVEGNYITQGGMDDVVEIYGSEGVIKVELTFGSPLRVYSRAGFAYAVEKTDFTRGWTRPALDENVSLGYRDEMAHFAACMMGREKQRRGTTAIDGYNVLRTVETLYLSNRERRTITLRDNGEATL
jgi:predicted dehydrogenase